MDPERAHHLIISALKNPFLSSMVPVVESAPCCKRECFGLQFPNPVGLAAGLDKNGEVIDGFARMGFGFVEIGTITPKPQPGNPQPRLFRLRNDEAIINRMGFNNVGALEAARNLGRRKSSVIVGGNIGKNKSTENADAASDYEICFRTLFDLVDYFVVNVSSPNTPGLRELQERDALERILSRVQNLNQSYQHPKPILLKIAPDLSIEQMEEIVAIVNETQINGVIATNTTISRRRLPHYLPSEIERYGAGGLSGRPLTKKATEIITELAFLSKRKIPIVGVGGIMTANDALDKFRAGAALIQLYSGFIYHGPQLIREICEALPSLVKNQSEIVP